MAINNQPATWGQLLEGTGYGSAPGPYNPSSSAGFSMKGPFAPPAPPAQSSSQFPFASTLPSQWANVTPGAPASYTQSGGGGGGGMPLGIGSAVLGGVQTIGGLIGLASLKDPEDYSLTADNQMAIGEAKNNARFGFSGAQKAAYDQSVRQAANTDIYNARNMAGSSLSRAVFGVRRGQTLGALNDLALKDADFQQRKIGYRDSMIQRGQEVQDRNTANRWNQYNQKMAAYGGALQSGLTNLGGFFNLGAALKYVG